jgi:hypothetical protein
LDGGDEEISNVRGIHEDHALISLLLGAEENFRDLVRRLPEALKVKRPAMVQTSAAAQGTAGKNEESTAIFANDAQVLPVAGIEREEDVPWPSLCLPRTELPLLSALEKRPLQSLKILLTKSLCPHTITKSPNP